MLVVALLGPEAAVASTGGVAAPTAGSQPSGGASPVRAPKPRKRKRRRRSAVPATVHRFPVAGPFQWPGPGGAFGAPRSGHTHQGFDLLAAQGVPVVAPYAGTVTFVAYQAGGAGYYVVLDSDYDYVFMHLAAGSTRVRVGQKVVTGQRIADVGATGEAEGPHLHFEVWLGRWQQGGRPIDPKPLLDRWLAASS
jgi:murein DD-endopeptidase MepM/ murein hydrolase activator NlpD